MSKRDWRQHTPILVGIVIVAALAVSGGIATKHTNVAKPANTAKTADKKVVAQTKWDDSSTQEADVEGATPPRAPVNEIEVEQDALREGRKPADTNQPKDDDGVRWTDRWMTIFTAALAAVAFAQLIAAGLQAMWTWSAVNVARESAVAAQNSVKAFTASQFPKITISQLAFRRQHNGHSEWFILPLEGSSLVMAYENIGPTPASIVSACLQWTVAAKLPIPPIYANERMVPFGQLVLRCGGIERIVEGDDQIEFTEEQRTAVREGRSKVWAFGFVKYVDFAGGTHTFGFCASLHLGDPQHGRPAAFVHDGPPEYNYRRYSDPNT